MSDHLRIQGTLLRDAISFLDRKSGQYVVRVLVDQQCCEWPYLADIPYGTGAAASIAAGSARNHMRRGLEVVVHGRDGLKPRRNVKDLDGVNCLELQHPTFIEHAGAVRSTSPASSTLAEEA